MPNTNIHAFTELGAAPAYISINHDEATGYTVTVRDRKGVAAQIALPEDALRRLAHDITARVPA